MNLQVEVLNENEVHYFKIIGEVDAFTAPTLKERLEEVKEIPGLNAKIDLSEVDYIDSTGLGIFIGFYKSVKAHDGHVKIVGVNDRLKRLFEITGIDKVIEVESEKGGDQ